MKDELDEKIKLEFAALKPKTYNHLIDDSNENKKNTRHKKVCHKSKT